MTDAEKIIQAGIYWVVKQAYDLGANPYFDKDGELITIPEAIDHLLPIAEKEASGAEQKDDFPTNFGDKWFKKIKFIAPEKDPNLEPAKTEQFGLSPAQVYFMKCTHEYYLAHIIMWNPEKTFKSLQSSGYDMKFIVDLQRKNQSISDADLSFDEIRNAAIDAVIAELG
jgi:hypothetical protein